MGKRLTLPWLIAAALLFWALIQGRGTSGLEDRAIAAEAAVATLRPLADSLRAEAVRRDTVLVAVTDTVRVTVTQERVVQVALVDTLRATLDSTELPLLDSLVASEEREDVAQDRLQAETLLWGQSWQRSAEANLAGWNAERARGDAWEAVARARKRQAWYERLAVAVVVTGVLVLR